MVSSQLVHVLEKKAPLFYVQVGKDIPEKTGMQCFHRETEEVFNGVTKGGWSPEDDARVTEHVNKIGAKKWSCIAAQVPGRTEKQCRERWHNHLNPSISKAPWTSEEVRSSVENDFGGKPALEL